MGVCEARHRVAVYHRNIPMMISRISELLSYMNVASMSNTSRGEYAYTMVDVDGELKMETGKLLRSIDGVFRVRVIK